MQELFIKCPSCGVVLGVKNSKNEAVKKIVCPQCKQHLAVSFEEEIQPSTVEPQPLDYLYDGDLPIMVCEGTNKTRFPGCDKVGLEVVRLVDGSCKCIVSALNADVVVKVNGEQLQQGDKLVLAFGDRLEIDHHVLSFGKPVSAAEQKKEENPQSVTSDMIPASSRSYRWLPYAVAVLAFGIAAIVFWPHRTEETVPTTDADTIGAWPVINPPVSAKQENVKTKEKEVKKKDTSDVSPQKKASITQYDLNQLANKGDADAQYELGRLYVQKGGVNNTVLGLNYLRQASLNGSTKASEAYRKCMDRLQQQAAGGDSIAQVILISVK